MNKQWNLGDLNRGKSLSDSLKQKISQSVRDGYRKGRRVWNKGKAMPDEVKQKISFAKKGKPARNKGIPRTYEEKKKMSEGAKRMWMRRKAE